MKKSTANSLPTIFNRVYKDMTKDGLRLSFVANREYTLAKDRYTATTFDDYLALSFAIRDRIVERWIATQERYHDENVKRVYYFSLEFLIGRLLGTNMINLGLFSEAEEAAKDLGLNLEELRECESDAGLGNGGLGRLAACFLDSMATLGMPAQGYGIRYEYGIFNQKIINGYQVEFPDEWLRKENPWEFPRQEYTVKVRFGGRVFMSNDPDGRLRANWVDTDDVLAMPFDIPIVGYKNNVVNTLRLWSARASEEFDFSYFNSGDYERAVYDKVLTENISKVLYPNDNVSQGRELRLKQEYFLTSASLSDIIRRFKMENKDLKNLPDKAAIQLNDTHPSIAIPELMRRLVDEEGMEWDDAWDVTIKTFAYTNHTIMPEALECWPVSLFERLLPRHLQIIYEINLRFLKEVSSRFPGDNDRLRRMSLIEESNPKKVRMGNLAVVGSHAINGVSELHTRLLKTILFKDFYELWPERFKNITNGITQRRWLQKANPDLSAIITDAIGDKWATNLYELKKLLPLKEDASFRERWQRVKLDNKKNLAQYIKKTTGVEINPYSLFDVQIKRLHEYKRQLLFSLYIISQYLKLKKNPSAAILPRTFIFSGKAAPGYFTAKLIIKFITSLADVINNDKEVGDRLKVVFLENYRVSLAEKIFPASELSEQISTAGTEASGTGCMKFMINGALTIGTLDGANIEIAEEVGKDNIFIFGLKADEIIKIRSRGYNPMAYIEASPALREILNLIKSNFLSPVEFGLFDPIINNLMYTDYFFVCADFDSYCAMQDTVSKQYVNKTEWTKKSIINVAKSGKFSSDRAVREYAKTIWDMKI
ncbi:MAG: glycogen/starch/alpha-glucan phosphorylase [Candidatus Omnitrophica bacterium]|nr:glycogen/starch/alpha-glucan phosphorylase [Candidatus Omnitrophota bacterium]MCM8790331.1 glycogen/starch/alpha-glucan phosphorylase [Candidatus Omnitrophota bacterium]